jgi:hypothetical protein
MPLAEYLASEQAREDVRKTIDKWPLHPLGNEWRWTIESEGQWVRLSVWSMWADGYPKGAEASAYYRPDGERHTVTDMGEGIKARRLRTGDLTQPAYEPRICWQHGDVLGADKITAADLPDAICRVMLASLRVAQS